MRHLDRERERESARHMYILFVDLILDFMFQVSRHIFGKNHVFFPMKTVFMNTWTTQGCFTFPNQTIKHKRRIEICMQKLKKLRER